MDLDIAVIALMARWMAIAPEIHRSSMLGIHGERSKRLVDLSRHFGASRYLSGAAARDYLEVGLFDQQGITVVWQDYQHPVYTQQHGDFVPYLSALDLVLNCGDDSRSILESGNL